MKQSGVDLLDKSDRVVQDKETAELLEPPNDRIEDSLSSALNSILRKHPGGFISQQQFAIITPETRDTEIVFDRYYWQLGLLVDMLAMPMNDQDKLANSAHIEEHSKFAQLNGYKYLPITGGATLGEIESAIK